jgi:hypothetical protein
MSENPNPQIRKDIIFGLTIGGVTIGAVLLVALGRTRGLIDAEQVMRANNIIVALALAAFSNAIPKMYGPPPQSISQATLKQELGRFSSWALTLGSLTWAALWSFAPRELARVGSLVAVVTSLAVTVGYTVWKCVTHDMSRSH